MDHPPGLHPVHQSTDQRHDPPLRLEDRRQTGRQLQRPEGQHQISEARRDIRDPAPEDPGRDPDQSPDLRRQSIRHDPYDQRGWRALGKPTEEVMAPKVGRLEIIPARRHRCALDRQAVKRLFVRLEGCLPRREDRAAHHQRDDHDPQPRQLPAHQLHQPPSWQGVGGARIGQASVQTTWTNASNPTWGTAYHGVAPSFSTGGTPSYRLHEVLHPTTCSAAMSRCTGKKLTLGTGSAVMRAMAARATDRNA